jgi:hypothetical protein
VESTLNVHEGVIPTGGGAFTAAVEGPLYFAVVLAVVCSLKGLPQNIPRTIAKKTLPPIKGAAVRKPAESAKGQDRCL